MPRTVICRKLQRELEGLSAPPFPGPTGQKIFETVSEQAWTEWLGLQTMLINEHRLNVREASTRTYLSEQREKFLNNEETDRVEGYVSPQDGGENPDT